MGVLCLALAVLLTPMGSVSNAEQLAAGYHKISIENNSDCIIIAVTIVKVVHGEDGGLASMDLYWAEWLEPGQQRFTYFKEGEHYAVLVEAFKYDHNTRKAIYKIGEQYKEGPFDPNATDSRKIDVRCQHTQLKDT